MADFDVEIDTPISDHIVAASKSQHTSDDKVEGKVRSTSNIQDNLEKEDISESMEDDVQVI